MINGNRVKQVRELRGLTQTALAGFIGVKQSAIAQIESGMIAPSDKVLQNIVLQTGFPVSFFRQPNSIDFPLGSLLFRARASMTLRERCKARQYARTVFEVAERMEQSINKIPLRLPRLNNRPNNATRLTRSALGLSPDTPIPNLMQVIERNGVHIIALSKISKTQDAFSAWVGNHERRPIIIVFGTEHGDRQRFSVAHELGHLVMHQAITGEISKIEQEANCFASEFLMPKEAILQELISPITIAKLIPLKQRWKVSIQALIRRSYDLEVITKRQYSYLMKQITIRGWRIEEPNNFPPEKPRLICQMAEMLYGNPVDHKRLASQMNLPNQFVKEMLEVHGVTVQSKTSNKPSQLLSFP